MKRDLRIGAAIERQPAPSPEVFRRDFLWRDRPVIFTDLHRGTELSTVKTSAAAAKRFGDIKITVNRNYYDGGTTAANEHFRCSLSEYLAFIAQNPETPLMCTEQTLAPEVAALVRAPALAKAAEYQPPVGFMFFAKKGLVAPLHFDGDLRDVLFTQVYGRKRVVLMPPRFSRRLLPVGNSSALSFHLLPEAEKRTLFELNEACSCVLEPGETLFIPRLWWHYLENVETSMSISLRFGRSTDAFRLSTLPSTHTLQNLVGVLLDRKTGRVKNRALFTKVFETYFAPHASPTARFERYMEVLDAAYARHCPQALQGHYEGGSFDRRGQEHDGHAPVGSAYNPGVVLQHPAEDELGPKALARFRRWWERVAMTDERKGQLMALLALEPRFSRLTALDEVIVRQQVASLRAPSA